MEADRQDELTVVRCQLGERDAFADLLERWHLPVWTFVRRMTGDADRSDDLVQEIWMRVVRGLPRLEDPGRFPAWLFTIARRTMRDDLRRNDRRPDVDPATDPVDVDAPLARDEVTAVLERLEIGGALDDLAPRDREAAVLYFVNDRPLAEVAAILDVPIGTVKSRLHRARRQLAAHLDIQEERR